MGTWQVLARMPDRTVGGLLTGWVLKLTLRLNEVGTWELTVPRERCPAGWPSPGCGVIALRDGAVVASGMWDEETFTWSASPGDDAAGPGTYSLTGDTDLGRLAYRLCYPTPGQPWNAQTNAYWVYPFDTTSTSHAEDVLRVTVNWQAGSLAVADRRVPGVRLGTAVGVGTQVRISERFTPLLDALRKIALAGGGLAFDMLDDLAGHTDFVVRQPVDRTSTARFGVEMGNVLDLTVRRVAPTATHALIAGGGELENRDLAEFADPAADPAWGRRESFVDQRQVDDTTSTDPDQAAQDEANRQAEYEKAAAEAFASGGEQTGVSATIRDTPTVAWGRDYDVGDQVSVLTPAGAVADLVRQVSITVDAKGNEDITSVIGSADATVGDPLAATVKSALARISQLERSL